MVLKVYNPNRLARKASTSWSNSLIIGIYPDARAQSHDISVQG